MMNNIHLPNELPKEPVELIGAILKGGSTIENPYADDYFKLMRIKIGIDILNDLIDRRDPMLNPKIRKFKLPKIFKDLVKEMGRKTKEWKFP